MASIQKRGNAYYIRVSAGRSLDGKWIYKTMTYEPTAKSEKAREKEVRKQAALFEEQIKHGKVIPQKITFSKFYQKWQESGDAARRSTRTRQDYYRNIENYGVPVFGSIKIQDINAVTCQALIDDLTKSRAPATVHKVVASLDAVFNYAYRMQVIDENPLRRCTLPPLKAKNPDDLHYFTVEQARRFLAAIREPYGTTYTRNGQTITEVHTMPLQLQCFFYLAIYGGFRRGELLALTWKDIDFQNHRIDINKATSSIQTGNNAEHEARWEQIEKAPKTEAGRRSIEVPEQCFVLLRRWKAQERQLQIISGSRWEGTDTWHFDSNFIFIQDTGAQMDVNTPYAAFKRFIKRYNEGVSDPALKLPDIRLHDLRHTTATLLIAEGVDIETVSKRLGHAKASTTLDIYGHATQEKDREASNILNQLLG